MGFNISKLKIISFLILFSSRRCLFPVKVWFLESRSNWIYASPEIYSDISPDLYCSIEWLTSTWKSFTPLTLKIARIVNVALYKHRALGGLAFFLSRIRPPVSYTLHLALEYVAVLPPSVIRLLVSIMPFSVSQGFEGLQVNILKLGFRIWTNWGVTAKCWKHHNNRKKKYITKEHLHSFPIKI